MAAGSPVGARASSPVGVARDLERQPAAHSGPVGCLTSHLPNPTAPGGASSTDRWAGNEEMLAAPNSGVAHSAETKERPRGALWGVGCPTVAQGHRAKLSPRWIGTAHRIRTDARSGGSRHAQSRSVKAGRDESWRSVWTSNGCPNGCPSSSNDPGAGCPPRVPALPVGEAGSRRTRDHAGHGACAPRPTLPPTRCHVCDGRRGSVGLARDSAVLGLLGPSVCLSIRARLGFAIHASTSSQSQIGSDPRVTQGVGKSL